MMNHPQSTAIELFKEGYQLPHLEQIGKTGCCAFVFLWWLGLDIDDIQAIKIVSDAITAKVIEDDCTVVWSKFCSWLAGRNLDVGKYFIKDILTIKAKTPVMWKYKGNPHWVGVEKGIITFNPLIHSEIVEHGNPVEKRVLCLKGVAK